MSTFKRFLSYYKPHQKIFYIDMVCALVISIIDLAFPQILNFLTKGLFSRSASEIISSLVYIFIGLMIMYLIRYICIYYVTSWGHIMGARMESDMRKDLFEHYQKLSFSYYDKNNTGEMMSKLVSDLFDISELAHHGPENLFISSLKILGSFTLLMFINVKMTLILLGVTAIMVVFSIYKNKRMQSSFMDNRRKIAKVNSRLQDSLAGIRIVKSFASEDIEKEKFNRANIDFLESKHETYNVVGVFQAGNSFFQGLLYTAVLVSGGYFVAKRSLELTDLAIYALYIGIFINPLEVLINFTEQFQKGYAGFRRFAEILETSPEVKEKENAVDLENILGNITYENVTFAYDGNDNVLKNINISIEEGETVALVGPSGGGKSTICSLLPRFYDIREGNILIDEIDIRDLKLKSLRKTIGIVQQDVYLFDGTIKDNISYGSENISDEDIVNAAKNANIHDFIMSLEDGYETYVGERGTRLSGGQKQRISIARVFLKNPKILILDEATSALDNESELHIQNSLEKLSKHRTTIVIAHRLSTIRNANKIIVVDNGVIKEVGDHKTLINKNGIYAKYYNMQFEGNK